jgi:hypothetical protein
MTCPRCHCAQCRTAIANEQLRAWLVSRETKSEPSPVSEHRVSETQKETAEG